jgi:lysophospholipase L1-like esterase
MKLKPLPDQPLRCLHLGDSYTIGEGVDPQLNWPCQLRESLQRAGCQINEARIIARTGWTTRNLLDAINSDPIDSHWDLVTLCIGVNNQYQSRPLAEFRKETVELIDLAKSLRSPGLGQLILLSIPDWSITPFPGDRDRQSIAREIDTFNETVMEIAEEESVSFLNWTPLSRRFADVEGAFVEDGLHPSAKQYAEWAEYLAKHLLSAD